jgi:hypothetical protein
MGLYVAKSSSVSKSEMAVPTCVSNLKKFQTLSAYQSV